MPAPAPKPPSKGHINRCGALLADQWLGGGQYSDVPYEKLVEAYEVVNQFRASHSAPMNSIAMGLRSMVRTATREEPAVSQRLKRIPRIIRKISRMSQQEPTLLARLEDIGGCRAVVGSLDQLEAVKSRIERNWGPVIRRRRDYVEYPKLLGYRAAHFTVERSGVRIEVQIRTRNQQAWADAVEALDSRKALTLKDGVGPQSVVEYFRLAGDYLCEIDLGNLPSPELQAAFARATDIVVEEGYYVRRRRND